MNAYWYATAPSPVPFPAITGYALADCRHPHDPRGRHIAIHAAPRVPLHTRAARAVIGGARAALAWVLRPEYLVYRRLTSA